MTNAQLHELEACAPDSPLPCTGGRLRKLTRRMTSFYEQHLRSIGIKLSQYSVLMNISTEPQTLLQLAARLEMDRTTLTRSLKPMIDQGWVAEVAGDDARQRLLILTACGHRFRKQAQQVWHDAQLALEAQLGRNFVADLNAQLDRALSQLKPALAEEN
jgi:DNA-binding MarR family transcriptional regulator